jgi:hypothetical protein
MPGRSRSPLSPGTSDPYPSFGLPQLQLDPTLFPPGSPGFGQDPNLLGNQGTLDLNLHPWMLDPSILGPGMMGPGMMGPGMGGPGQANPDLFNLNIPAVDPGLRLPFLDGIPGGGMARDWLNDWIRDPYGLNGPQPHPALSDNPRQEFDPCTVTTDPGACREATEPHMLTTPAIPIPGT